MKKTIKLALLTAVIAATGLSTRAQDQGGGAPAGAPPRPPQARFGEALAQTLARYDVNHDGQLDQSEMAALQKDIADGKVQQPGPPPGGPQGPGRRGPGPGLGFGGGPGEPGHRLPKEILEKYDVNQDGKLDETERAALEQDIRDGKIQPPPTGRGPRGGNRPPRPSASQIIQHFDIDHDGKLDESELTSFLNSTPPPPGPRPPQGPDGAQAPEPPQAPAGGQQQ